MGRGGQEELAAVSRDEVASYSDLRLVRAVASARAHGDRVRELELLREACERLPFSAEDDFDADYGLSARAEESFESWASHLEEMERIASRERARGHQDGLNGVKPRGSSSDYMAGYRSAQP